MVLRSHQLNHWLKPCFDSISGWRLGHIVTGRCRSPLAVVFYRFIASFSFSGRILCHKTQSVMCVAWSSLRTSTRALLPLYGLGLCTAAGRILLYMLLYMLLYSRSHSQLVLGCMAQMARPYHFCSPAWMYRPSDLFSPRLTITTVQALTPFTLPINQS